MVVLNEAVFASTGEFVLIEARSLLCEISGVCLGGDGVVSGVGVRAHLGLVDLEVTAGTQRFLSLSVRSANADEYGDMPVSTSRRLIAAVLIIAVLIVGIGLSFAGEPFGVDAPVMGWFVAHRSATITTAVSVFSDCFGPMMVAVWTAVFTVALAVRDRNFARPLAVGASVAAAGLVTEVVKLAVARPRPPLQFHPSIAETTLSYPSGHVTGTCALAVTVALVGTATLSARARRWAVTAALLLGVVIAATRLYLGIHWISDVAAGIAVGTAVSLVVPELVMVGLAEIDRRRPALLPSWMVPSGSLTKANELPVNR